MARLTSKVPWTVLVIVDDEEGANRFTGWSHSRPELLPRKGDDIQLFASLKERIEKRREKKKTLKTQIQENSEQKHFRQSDIKLILYSQHFSSPTAIIFFPPCGFLFCSDPICAE